MRSKMRSERCARQGGRRRVQTSLIHRLPPPQPLVSLGVAQRVWRVFATPVPAGESIACGQSWCVASLAKGLQRLFHMSRLQFAANPDETGRIGRK
jgi:hypothetical protein